MILPVGLQPCGTTNIALPNGLSVELLLCRHAFQRWNGAFVSFDYGGKQLINHEEEPCFAELAILRTLRSDGWDGVWVESFGGPNFVRTMPVGWALKSECVSIPTEKEVLLKKIWASAGSFACFDVFAWKDDDILFCEAKRARRDRLTKPQHKFIEGALACGIRPEAMLIVEWELIG